MDEMRPVRAVPLTRGMFAIIDPEDWPLVGRYVWHTRKGVNTWYAYRQITGQPMQGLHALLTGQLGVDHRNGNGLDNRRLNLRSATVTQNHGNQQLAAHNTSGFKGAHLYRQTGRYRAEIQVHGRRLHLGYYVTLEEAARAYDAAARDAFGEYACLNFPLPGERGCR